MADTPKTAAPENFGGLQPGESNARAVRHTETKTTTTAETTDLVAVPPTGALPAAPTVTPAKRTRAPKAAAKAAKKPAERTR